MRASHRQPINDNQCGAINKSRPGRMSRRVGRPSKYRSLLRHPSSLIAIGNPVLGDDRLHRITFGSMFQAPPAGHPFPTVITPGTPPVATRMPAEMVHRIAAGDDGRRGNGGHGCSLAAADANGEVIGWRLAKFPQANRIAYPGRATTFFRGRTPEAGRSTLRTMRLPETANPADIRKNARVWRLSFNYKSNFALNQRCTPKRFCHGVIDMYMPRALRQRGRIGK